MLAAEPVGRDMALEGTVKLFGTGRNEVLARQVRPSSREVGACLLLPDTERCAA